MTDITELAQQELAQLRAELSNQAIGSKDHLRKIALSLVDKLEKYRDREIRWLALSDEKSKIITDQEEALEKAKGMETYWKTQCRGITDHCEELQARIAELESHTVKPPVHPTVASENLDDETLQELIEFRRTTFEYHSKEGNKVQTIIHGVTLAALRELQERRKAAMDSEPVAYAWVSRSGKKHLTRCEPEQWRDAVILTPLYRHAQPAPVVPDFKKLALELVGNLVDCGGLDEGVKERYLEWAEKTCRAAMLNGGES